ncbi:MAG: hypothetical protein V4687_05770 [Bacteroidota bacterium]
MKFRLLFLGMCLASVVTRGQQDSTAEKTTITAAALYNSNINYYGQSTNEKLPYALFNATVRLPSGIYFSAGAYKLLNYGSGLSEGDLGLGYDYDINDQLSLGGAYTHSFFPANSPLLQASNNNNLNFSATYTLPFLKSSFNADYAFGQQNDIFISLNNSKEITLGNFFSDKNTFYIEPGVEFVAGTSQFYETYTVSKNKRDQAKGKAPLNPGNSGNATQTTVTVASNSFSLLSYNFKLPLSFSRANYVAELNYQFSILGPNAGPDLKKQQSYFGLAFYYQF